MGRCWVHARWIITIKNWRNTRYPMWLNIYVKSDNKVFLVRTFSETDSWHVTALGPNAWLNAMHRWRIESQYSFTVSNYDTFQFPTPCELYGTARWIASYSWSANNTSTHTLNCIRLNKTNHRLMVSDRPTREKHASALDSPSGFD